MVYSELWSIIKIKKSNFIANIVLTFILASTGPFALFAQAYYIDVIEELVGNNFEISNVILPASVLFLSFIIPNISLLHSFLNSKFNLIININWSKKINNIVSQIPYWHYENETTYDKIKQINENNLYNTIFSFFFSFISVMISIIMYAIILIQVSFWLAISVIIFAPFVGYFSAKIADKQFKKINKLNPDRRRGIYKSSILRNREFTKEIRINNSNDFMLNDWMNTQKNIDNKTLKVKFKYGFLGALIAKTEYIIILLNLIIVLSAYLNGYVSLGIFISLSNQIFTMRLLSKIQDISSQYGVAKSINNSYKDIVSSLKSQNDSNINVNYINTIEFQNVSFRYPNADEYILKNVSFLISCGESVAIVGENGAGKSTLIKLLLGLYEPIEGNILINGIDSSLFSPVDKAKIFGVAFQDYAKFALKLGENISFYDEDAEVIEVAKQFNIDFIAQKYDKGYHITLGKAFGESVDISGGQWQSIAIARALCGQTKNIFIFDEPTAALDPINEVETFQKISTLTKEKTTIYITHRLGFTNKVDKILLIKNNTVYEEGSFNDLIQLKGEFYKLYSEQRALYIR